MKNTDSKKVYLLNIKILSSYLFYLIKLWWSKWLKKPKEHTFVIKKENILFLIPDVCR